MRFPLRLLALTISLYGSVGMAASNRVFFITGAPVDNPGVEVRKGLKLLSDHLEKYYPETRFTVFHNSKWRDLCKALSSRGNNDKLVLLGHSWGAQAIVDVAHCLEKSHKEIPFAITLDPIQKAGHLKASIVPENLAENHNFFQNYDWLLQGYRDLHRKDKSYDGITNNFVEMRGYCKSNAAHSSLFAKLTEENIIQDLIDDYMND